MIIARTPLRISYVGGGTDFEDYYKISSGAVISTTINRYIYVTLNHKFDNKIHLRYSEFECVDHIEELKHNLVKEALRLTGITKAIEIVTISDIPTKGSGLGSSSALAVGLLNSLYAYKGYLAGPDFLANQACNLEIDNLGSPIGRQDQYPAAYGGVNYIEFNDNGIKVNNLYHTANYHKIKLLEESTMLFYLGEGHSSNDILSEHKAGINDKIGILNQQKGLVNELNIWLHSNDDTGIEVVGKLVNLSWEYKQLMTPSIKDAYTDNIIDIVLKVSEGVKICGAGKNGFMLVICRKDKQHIVRKLLNHLKELEVKYERNGSKIVYTDQYH